MVSFGLAKIYAQKEPCEFVVLVSRCLFQLVERLLQMTHTSFTFFRESLWNFHVHLFIQVSMQKCIIDIQLMYKPIFLSSNQQKNKHGNKLCNWCKSVMIIYPHSICVNPFAISLALYHSISQFGLYLIL